MAKPTSITHPWADSGTTTEPADGKKDSGWLSGERPPFQWMNWWQNQTDGWISYLDDSFHLEHDEDGEHSAEVIKRVQLLEARNLIVNPTATAGNYGWRKTGGGTCNWDFNNAFEYKLPGGVGRYWLNDSAGAEMMSDESDMISVPQDTVVVLSGEVYASNGSAGVVSISIQPFTIVHGTIGDSLCICSTSIDGIWQRVQAKVALPATTAYVRVRKWHVSGVASLGAIRNLKLEVARNIVIGEASGYSDDMAGEAAAFDEEHDKLTGLHRDDSIVEDYLADGSIVRGAKLTEAPNLLVNPTGRQGLYGWRKLSALHAVSGAPDFTVQPGGSDGSGRPNFHLTSGVTAFKGMASERIPVTAGWTVSFSGKILINNFTGTTKDVTVEVACYKDNGGAEEYLSAICQVEYTESIGPLLYASFSATGVVPATTEWVRVACWMSTDDGGVDDLGLKDLQLNIGAVASVHADPASHDEKVVLVAKPDFSQVFEHDTETTVAYATTALNTSQSTFTSSTFEAHRHMIVRVSASVRYSVIFAAASQQAELRAKKTPYGGAAAVESVLDRYVSAAAETKVGYLSGSHIVELECGDLLLIALYQDSTNNLSTDGADPSYYAVCIEEV